MRKNSAKPINSITQQIILTILIVVTLYFGALGLKSIAVPVSTINGSEEIIYQSIEHDFRVFPSVSILYPEGTEPIAPGNQSFFTALTEKIEFQVTGKITADTFTELTGNIMVDLILSSEGQWEKRLPLDPEIIADQSESGAMLYRASFKLPLEAAKELGERIITETQVRPRSGLTLVIRSTLSTPLPTEGNPSPNESIVTGEYRFTIDGPFIIPEGNLLYEDVTIETKPVSIQNHVSLLGLPVTVSAGRFLFPSLFILCALVTGKLYLDFHKNRQAAQSKGALELGKIRKRYGSRVVRADTIKAPEGTIKVELSDYPELAKIADELEKPIIEIIFENNSGRTTTGYYVLDGKTLYVYRLQVTR